MSLRKLIGVLVGGVLLFLLVRNLAHARRPAWESHVTGDAAAKAGIAAVERGEFAEAVRALDFAMKKPHLEVADGAVFAALGKAYAGLDREGQGESQRHKALVYQGLAHRAQGKNDEAKAAFGGALSARPDFALAHESLGSLLLSEHRYDQAIPHLERAVELDPVDAVTRSNLAIAYALKGRSDDAELQAREAERLGYPNSDQLKTFVARAREERARRP